MNSTPSLSRLISVVTLLTVTAAVHAAPAANTPRPLPRYGTIAPVSPAVQQRDQAYSSKVTQEATAARATTTAKTSTIPASSAATTAAKNTAATSATTNPTRSDLYQSMTRSEYQAKYPVTVK